MARKPLDLVGHRYGRLTVVEQVLPAVRYSRWRCLCDCGTERIVTSQLLRNKYTLSCGCLHSEQASANLRRMHAQGRMKPPPPAANEAWRDLDRCMTCSIRS
jgi:hypothetical protein